MGEVDDAACGEWPFLEKFDGVIVSGLERLVKPDPRIYRVFCERYGLAPESCVFIDDSEPNVIAARKFGMQRDPLHDAAQLLQRPELIELGLPLEGASYFVPYMRSPASPRPGTM